MCPSTGFRCTRTSLLLPHLYRLHIAMAAKALTRSGSVRKTESAAVPVQLNRSARWHNPLYKLTNQTMKKILYSLFALSTLLFTATSCTEDRGTTTEVEESNDDESVNPNHIRGYGDAEPGGTQPADPEAGQMYGFDIDKLSGEMKADLGVDDDIAAEMVRVYYDRSRQLSELEQRVQANADGAGADMEAERKRIDGETDRQVQGILSPEQYKTYQQNRSKYANPTSTENTAEGTTTGSED